jgi:hypothetical protein
MRFIEYRRPEVRDCKIDWEAAVQVSEEVRRALHPHDVDALHAGRLRRPFLLQPPELGRRSRQGAVKHPGPEPIPHERGALVFAFADESCFFIEAPDSGP